MSIAVSCCQAAPIRRTNFVHRNKKHSIFRKSIFLKYFCTISVKTQFSLIAPQAVHLFSNRNGFMRHASPSRRVEAHRYLIILTLAAASLGFLGIFVHKTRLDKRHFLTWHSWLGAATLLVFLGQGVGGSLLYYRFLARRFASLHAVGALLSFSLAVGALLLACWSNWARATFTPPLLVALLLLPATNLTELLQQLMQAGRFPRAYRSLFGESKSMGCRR